MYCTQAELVAVYGEREIIQLSDRVTKPPVAIDADVVEKAIKDAGGEIDLHLAARYKLPIAVIPDTIKRIATQLAYRNLHRTIKEDHPAETDAVRARELLKGISTGRLSLGFDDAGAPVPINDTVQVSPGRNDWGNGW